VTYGLQLYVWNGPVRHLMPFCFAVSQKVLLPCRTNLISENNFFVYYVKLNFVINLYIRISASNHSRNRYIPQVHAQGTTAEVSTIRRKFQNYNFSKNLGLSQWLCVLRL
jgi:hypothetical protein